VDATGRLHRRGGEAIPGMGPPVAALGTGELLSGSTRPPDEPDALLMLRPGDAAPQTLLALPAALRAIAVERRAGRIRCVLALEAGPGQSALFSVEWEPVP
jgi:hypothetical protein